ncbi:MAG: uroporphyrinogen decarboxylase family protein [Melioribacteraceae bacterium]
MTSKERMICAMNLEVPDRIPVMAQFSIGFMLQQLNVSPSEFWFDKNVFKKGLIKLREEFGFDGILVSLFGHDPYWKSHLHKVEKTESEEIIIWDNGDIISCPNNDLPIYNFFNEIDRSDIDNLITNHLPEKLNYIPVSQNLPFYINEQHKFDVLKEIVTESDNKYSVHGEITSPFDYYLDLTGHQDGLIHLIDFPEKCKLILAHFTKLIKESAVEMCNTGIDAIKVSSPFAGSGFISPDDYREFVLPYEKEIVRAVREKGIFIYTHTCGSINDRLEIMFESGINGIECLDPEPIGDVELEDALIRLQGKGFIKGNADPVALLMNENINELLEDLKNRVALGKANSGFILSTACSIAPATPKKNILLMKEAVDKWGNI